MIAISLDDTTKTTIENIHWEWFKSRIYNSNFKFKHHKKKQDKDSYFSIPRIKVIKWILGIENEITLERIIKGHRNDLINFIKKFKRRIICEEPKEENFKSKRSFQRAKKKYKYAELLQTAFGYDDFQTPPKLKWYENFCKQNNTEWNAKILCSILKIDVCPYCNREYIFTYDDEKKTKKTLAEMDHFYPKSKYPYLSCSLYNLIPSCHTCNHGKREFGDNIIYPYEEDFGPDYSFRIKYGKKISILDDILDIVNSQIFINWEKKGPKVTDAEKEKNKKVTASIKTFHLTEIYNEHRVEIEDLVNRYHNYSNPKIDEITKLILHEKFASEGLQLSEEQIESFYQAFVETYNQRIRGIILGIPLITEGKEYPLRKFKEDIIKQLDKTASDMRKD